MPLRRATLRVWDALDLLGTLREYETALLEEEGLDPTLALHEHAGQTAEACRAAFPDLDWLHLVGLLHSLGKLLAHKRCALPPGSAGPRLLAARGHAAVYRKRGVSAAARLVQVVTQPCGLPLWGCGVAWSMSRSLGV